MGIVENDGVISFNAVREDEVLKLVEDFESMPVSTGTTDQNVQGAFASWSFYKAGVRAPGSEKAIDKNSVMMKLPSYFYSTTPVYYNTYMASLTIINPSSTTAKYLLEYSIEDDATGAPVWVSASSLKGEETVEAPGRTTSTQFWTLDLKNNQPAKFRIYQRGGNQNVATYVDNFTLFYTGEEGGPAVFPSGDVNGDQEVNIADVNVIIDIILGRTVPADVMSRADVNGDGEVNIADVNAIIDIILK